MRIPKKTSLAGLFTLALALSIPTLARSPFPTPQTPAAADVPVVKNGSGTCTADFVVTDASGKGIYNAKIEIQIRYGAFGLHRLDAIVSTNSDGKARMEGLPNQIKRATEFQVTLGSQSKSFDYDPQTDCHPTHAVLFQK